MDIKSAQGVKSKQIMFYSDLVHCNDLSKLFTVLEKTPSSTSLSICRERIKMDLNKIILYEEELASLYELIDRVSKYFELINFESGSTLKKGETYRDAVDPSPLINMGSSLRPTKQSSRSVPKLINFSTKAIGAKQAYKEFLRQKANDFSQIETDYYHIKEMLTKAQEYKININHIESEEQGKCAKHHKMINSLKSQLEVIQKIKLERDEENLLLKYENQQLESKLET